MTPDSGANGAGRRAQNGATGADPAFAAALRERLASLFGTTIAIERLALLAGGASKEAWALDLATPRGTLELLVRRAGGGVIHSQTLALEDEHRVVAIASAAGVRVPKPYGYLGEVAGRPAFVTERVSGETIGRRVVQRPELAGARAGLPVQMAEELAKIHAIPAERLPFLSGGGARDVLVRLEGELDALDEPHPAIELGLAWARHNAPEHQGTVVAHGDFRVGNLVVTIAGLASVLDWEFAHLGDPAEDVAWPLVRAWRFGVDQLRLGGIGAVEPYLERYNALTGRDISPQALAYWEIVGNLKWAIGALTQSRRHLSGQQKSVELAVLGRLAAEMEFE
ncbi:MAG TPA: phosphotransferase family protein, partial [Candidatus Limnocylindria bacterium]|nr:phosphotransferase family protein [Candidatus Limnocylindria bacterium]